MKKRPAALAGWHERRVANPGDIIEIGGQIVAAERSADSAEIMTLATGKANAGNLSWWCWRYGGHGYTLGRFGC